MKFPAYHTWSSLFIFRGRMTAKSWMISQPTHFSEFRHTPLQSRHYNHELEIKFWQRKPGMDLVFSWGAVTKEDHEVLHLIGSWDCLIFCEWSSQPPSRYRILFGMYSALETEGSRSDRSEARFDLYRYSQNPTLFKPQTYTFFLFVCSNCLEELSKM